MLERKITYKNKVSYSFFDIGENVIETSTEVENSSLSDTMTAEFVLSPLIASKWYYDNMNS